MSVPSTMVSEVAHVYAEASSVQLVRLSTGDFQVLSPGSFGSLLRGPDYILASHPFAEALRTACGADVAVRETKILRRSTGESWSGFVEIIPIAELRGPEDLPRARLSGTGAWHFQHGSLFVSGPVRRALLAAGFADISFSPGFAQFGGNKES